MKTDTPRIPIRCTGNSCRSQMALGLQQLHNRLKHEPA